MMKSKRLWIVATATVCALAFVAMRGTVAMAAPLEFGIDRSNMATQWTLAPPQEPNASPFLTAEYNKPGNFEARRIAVLDGIARLHVQWFRDGFGKGSPDLFVDLLKLVHARGMKMLTVFGAAASDLPAGRLSRQGEERLPVGDVPPEQDQSRCLSEAHRGAVRGGAGRRRDRRCLRDRQ